MKQPDEIFSYYLGKSVHVIVNYSQWQPSPMSGHSHVHLDVQSSCRVPQPSL